MRTPSLLVLCLSAAVCLLGCGGGRPEPAAGPPGASVDPDRETALILDVVNAETRDALGRDYEGWKNHWVHEPYVVKTYVNLADGSGSETRGWDAVDDVVRTYLEDHPEPEPPPRPVEDADVRLYGDGAWVSYEQEDADQGRKRESRLMERVGGAWRIAGMHTTIYGPAGSE